MTDHGLEKVYLVTLGSSLVNCSNPDVWSARYLLKFSTKLLSFNFPTFTVVTRLFSIPCTKALGFNRQPVLS